MRVKLNLMAIVFLIVVFGLSSRSQSACLTPQRNKPPSIQSFTSSRTNLDFCPVFPDGSCGYIIKLEVRANDPNNDRLSYTYWVSTGQIVGKGAQVVWDFRRGPGGSIVGQQTARVEVTDGRGGKATSSVSVNVQICPDCDPGCPSVVVTGADSVNEGQVAVFTLTVSASAPQKLRYMWRATNGKLVKGQRSKTVAVRALGLPGDSITATVSIEGLDPTCSREASGISRIQKRMP